MKSKRNLKSTKFDKFANGPISGRLPGECPVCHRDLRRIHIPAISRKYKCLCGITIHADVNQRRCDHCYKLFDNEITRVVHMQDCGAKGIHYAVIE